MLWFTKKRPPSSKPCFNIGRYRLDEGISEFSNELTPLSGDELRQLNAVVTFKQEIIAHAPQAAHMGLTWEIVLGIVNNAIYKISAQWFGPRHEAGKTYRELTTYCDEQYKSNRNEALWSTSNGNVVLNIANFGDHSVVTVTLTSRLVRSFDRQ